MLRIWAILSIWVISTGLSQAQIPATAFFKKVDYSAAKLSPDASFVAMVRHAEDGQHLVLVDTDSLEQRLLINLSDLSNNESTIRGIYWLDNTHIATQLVEIKKGIDDLVDSRYSESLLITQITEETKTYKVRTKGWLVDPLPNQPGQFIYAKSSGYSKAYKLKINKLHAHDKKLNKLLKKDGGQFVKSNEVGSIEGYVRRWFLDQNGEVKASLYLTNTRQIVLSEFNQENQPVTLKSWSILDKFTKDGEDGEAQENENTGPRLIPIAMSAQGSSFYSLDIDEEQPRTLYLVDYAKNESEIVYQSDAYRIVDLLFSADKQTLLGVKVLNNGRIENQYIEQQPSESYHAAEPGFIHVPIAVNAANGIALFYQESFNQPGQFLLGTGDEDEASIIGQHYPHLEDKLLTRQEQGRVNVEGLDIPYILNLPQSSQPAPLIVMPHGGPIGIFDHPYFDLTTQYFVANGFAVLRVNFRGSSGHNQALQDAGDKQWGDLMLQDIYRSTLEVAGRADIKASEICIFGMSYGGYASAALTMMYPNLYQCSVNMAGVSDINLQLNATGRTEGQKAWLKEKVGDSIIDYDKLKQVSPVYMAYRLERPMLIIHGDEDSVVDIEHAHRLMLALDKYERPYEWYLIEGGEHSPESISQLADIFDHILNFIQQNISQTNTSKIAS